MATANIETGFSTGTLLKNALLGIALLLAWPAWLAADAPATTAQAKAHFAAGAEASRDGDFTAALAAFLAARDAGMSGPALHYNIGVCAWELGELDRAESAFRKAAEAPAMRVLAHYNLGLVALRRGDEAAAIAWFKSARDPGPRPGDADDTVRALAGAQLERLAPEEFTQDSTAPAGTGRAASRRPMVFLAANLGYDDNVILAEDGELLGVSDTGSALAELQFAAIAPLYADLSLEAGGFLLRHADLDEFDQLGAQADLLYRPAIGRWRAEFGAGYGLNQLDGERFEDRSMLLVGASRALAGGWRLRLRHRYEDIDGREPFEGLTGDRHETSVRLDRRMGGQRLRLEYRLELNDRAAAELSPDRHHLAAEWSWALPRRMEATAGFDWRYSDYALAGEASSTDRTERRGGVAAELRGPLGFGWDWALRYDWTGNSASLEAFDYTRHRVIAGVQAVF